MRAIRETYIGKKMARSPNPLLQRLGAPQIEPPWTLFEASLALVALALGMLLIAPASALLLSGDTNNPDTASWVLAWTIGLFVVGGFIVIRWRRTKEKFDALKFDVGRLPLPMMFIIGVGAALLGSLAALAGSGVLQTAPQIIGLPTQIGDVLFGIILLVIVQPVVDSLVFASVLLPRLRHTLGAYGGLIMMVLAFAGYHALVYGGRLQGDLSLWYGFVMPLVLGLCVGVARVWGGSTRSAIVLQIGYGVMSIAMLFLL